MAGTVIDGQYKLEMKRVFNASCERVYKAWTDPEALKTWMTPNPETRCIECDVDFKVGGSYRIVLRYSDGDLFIAQGEYTEIDPPHRLAFTWKWDKSSVENGTTLITIDVAPHGEQTELTFTHAKLASDESIQRHSEGWTGCLDGLESYFNGK